MILIAMLSCLRISASNTCAAFTLPYSGLSGSVSNTMQEFLSANDPKARELTPDIRLDYEDYLHFGFDSNSILLHLLSIDQQ